jgi:hypothetical protein
MYQQIYDIFSKKNAEEYILYVVQEKLACLADLVSSQHPKKLLDQKRFFNQLILSLAQGALRISPRIVTCLGVSLDNIFVRDTSTAQPRVIFSFKYENAYPRCYHKDDEIKKVTHIQTCSSYIVKILIAQMEAEEMKIVSEYDPGSVKKIKTVY